MKWSKEHKLIEMSNDDRREGGHANQTGVVQVQPNNICLWFQILENISDKSEIVHIRLKRFKDVAMALL